MVFVGQNSYNLHRCRNLIESIYETNRICVKKYVIYKSKTIENCNKATLNLLQIFSQPHTYELENYEQAKQRFPNGLNREKRNKRRMSY